MFSKEMIAVAVALVASVVFCEGAQKYRVESGGIVLDSPFALEIGSTEYSAAFGKWIRTSAYANYDPMARTTTTNFQYYATAHLSKPYPPIHTVSYFRLWYLCFQKNSAVLVNGLYGGSKYMNVLSSNLSAMQV